MKARPKLSCLEAEGLRICGNKSIRILSVDFPVINCYTFRRGFGFGELGHLLNNTLVNLIPVLHKKNLSRAGKQSLDLIPIFTHTGGGELSSLSLTFKRKR